MQNVSKKQQEVFPDYIEMSITTFFKKKPSRLSSFFPKQILWKTVYLIYFLLFFSILIHNGCHIFFLLSVWVIRYKLKDLFQT